MSHTRSILPTSEPSVKESLWNFATRYFPIPGRTLLGEGVRDSLNMIQASLPSEMQNAVNCRRQCEKSEATLDGGWVVPQEWTCEVAYICDLSTPDNRMLINSETNPFAVVHYSQSMAQTLSGKDLLPRLSTCPDLPHATPYKTSYYQQTWGFCVPLATYQYIEANPSHDFHVYIDATTRLGQVDWLECYIPGRIIDQEILLSTYVCHPELGNNGTSGPTVLTHLVQWLWEHRAQLKYSYRIFFAPETLGSLCILNQSSMRRVLQDRVIAGWVVTCVGDQRTWSYLETLSGTTLTDRISKMVLGPYNATYYLFHQRGSAECQWAYPSIGLPIGSIMRSKYGTYPEHHTSADNLSLISAEGLYESLCVYQECIQHLEDYPRPRAVTRGEPFLSAYGLKTVDTQESTQLVQDLLAYADGTRTFANIYQHIPYSRDFSDIVTWYERLKQWKLVEY